MQVYFPHDAMRAEQQEFVRDAAQAIAEQKVFFAHAPTGLGKTVSSLAPALSYALAHNKKVFFSYSEKLATRNCFRNCKVLT